MKSASSAPPGRAAGEDVVRCLLALLFALAFAAPARAQLGAPKVPAVRAALQFDALQPGQQAVLAIVADVPAGLHAQSATPSEETYIPFAIAVEPQDGVTAYAPQYPRGEDKTYPELGKLNVYEGRVVAYVPVEVAADRAVGPLTLRGTVTAQLCDDSSCYPPEDVPFEVTVNVGLTAGAPREPELFAGFDATSWATLARTPPPATQATVAKDGGAAGTFLYWFPVALFAGVLFNLVPCVLPVLPVKVLGFYETAQHDRAKCVALALAFSAGIVAAFAALAVPLFVLKTLAWGELTANPYFAAGAALVLVLMALQLFGAFEVALPAAVYNATPSHSSYAGNFAFGILTALLSTPCTFGLVVGATSWAATQPPLVAVLMMMTVGAGMALPYVALSFYPESVRGLARTGAFANAVKQTMGFWVLATAVFFAQPILPDGLRGNVAWALIYGLVALSGVYLLARTVMVAARPPRPGLLTTGAVLSTLLLTAGAWGAYDLARPRFDWKKYDDAALADARREGATVVKFTADWCANCHVVERRVFDDEATRAELARRGVVALKADLTTRDAPGWKLLRELNAVGSIPFTAVYLPGREVPVALHGLYSSDDLRVALEGK